MILLNFGDYMDATPLSCYILIAHAVSKVIRDTPE
jgi:hypothetical protein